MAGRKRRLPRRTAPARPAANPGPGAAPPAPTPVEADGVRPFPPAGALAGGDAPIPEHRILGDRYQLRARLGAGPASQVFLADDLLLSREVAVKVLRGLPMPAGPRRAQRTASLAARVQHPNLIRIYDVQGGRPSFLVLEPVDGRPLDLVLEAGPLPPGRALRIVDGVLAALVALHERGVVHRDVRPANILVGANGEPHLTSAGLAEASADPGAGLRADEGRLHRRPAPSPEQELGLTADARSDVYAVAVLIRTLLDQRPSAVEQVLEAATAEDPDDRPPEAGSLRSALRGAWARTVTATPPPSLAETEPSPPVVEVVEAEPPAPPRPRSPAPVPVVLGILLALVAAAVLATGAGGDAPPQPSPPATAQEASELPAPGAVQPTTSSLADLIAAAERDPSALGSGGQVLLTQLRGVEQAGGDERAVAAASLYGAALIGAARGGVAPEFSDAVADALLPEITLDSLLLHVADNPAAAGERGPTFLGALRDLADEPRAPGGTPDGRARDLGEVAATWTQQGLLSPSVGVTAVAALCAAPGGTSTIQELLVAVPGNQALVDTGVEVPAGGIVVLTAVGEVRTNRASAVSPEGAPTAAAQRAVNVVPDQNHGGLIARLGEGEPFFIGTDAVFPVATSGRLFLGINDTDLQDNTGAFEARLQVRTG